MASRPTDICTFQVDCSYKKVITKGQNFFEPAHLKLVQLLSLIAKQFLSSDIKSMHYLPFKSTFFQLLKFAMIVLYENLLLSFYQLLLCRKN